MITLTPETRALCLKWCEDSEACHPAFSEVAVELFKVESFEPSAHNCNILHDLWDAMGEGYVTPGVTSQQVEQAAIELEAVLAAWPRVDPPEAQPVTITLSPRQASIVMDMVSWMLNEMDGEWDNFDFAERGMFKEDRPQVLGILELFNQAGVIQRSVDLSDATVETLVRFWERWFKEGAGDPDVLVHRDRLISTARNNSYPDNPLSRKQFKDWADEMRDSGIRAQGMVEGLDDAIAELEKKAAK